MSVVNCLIAINKTHFLSHHHANYPRSEVAVPAFQYDLCVRHIEPVIAELPTLHVNKSVLQFVVPDEQIVEFRPGIGIDANGIRGHVDEAWPGNGARYVDGSGNRRFIPDDLVKGFLSSFLGSG